jgi:hypothetical protein
MALQQEIWVQDIKETLHQGSEFVKTGTDHSAFVANKTVHMPQSGAMTTIEKNRSSLPGTIAQRTDTELTYNLNEYTTDPVLITDLDELQTSYMKRQSVLSQHINAINERIGNEVAYEWSPSGSASLVLRTTGSATAELPNATATGTRLLTTKEDIAKMARKLDLDNVAKNDRYLLLPTSMYYELFGIDALIRNDFGRAVNMIDGQVNEIFGMKVFIRPEVVQFNNVAGGVKKAVGSADAVTDCLGAIAYQKASVASALGAIKVFANEDVAEYYGSVMSALVMHGAKNLRSDNKGIVALAQGYVAP